MMNITTAAMHNELDTRNAENIGEGRWIIGFDPTSFAYIPSHRELVLEQIDREAEDEINCRRFGQELYAAGTTFSLIHDIESGEDYFMPEMPGDELEEHQERRFGPCSTLVELFDSVIDMDMQAAE